MTRQKKWEWLVGHDGMPTWRSSTGRFIIVKRGHDDYLLAFGNEEHECISLAMAKDEARKLRFRERRHARESSLGVSPDAPTEPD